MARAHAPSAARGVIGESADICHLLTHLDTAVDCSFIIRLQKAFIAVMQQSTLAIQLNMTFGHALI